MHALSQLRMLTLAAALALSFTAAGCGSSDTPPTGEGPASEPLRVALLPILDVLPFHVAAQQGYFEKEGIRAEAIPVASALERDQLLQAGEADGMLGELSAAAVFRRGGQALTVVMSGRTATPNAPVFRVLAAPGSGIAGPLDLAGVPVGISENTVIEYVTDRLLSAEGLTADQRVYRSIPAIPERFQLLMEGRIRAATLPDPLAESAIAAGAVPVVDDASHPIYGLSVLAFRTAVIEERPEAIRGFLRAWDRAAGDINADPAAFRSLLLEKIRVPKNVQESFSIPPYPRAALPTPDQWKDVTAWLADRGIVEHAPAWSEAVSDDFLPR